MGDEVSAARVSTTDTLLAMADTLLAMALHIAVSKPYAHKVPTGR
jgi:hypothetical protein